ncbi:MULTISPECIES: hypothetical protein [unclassified Dysgonomonas]|uniref:hypothetical protein n=1 Tax=unclassified Dysgonomonas TaxID=2630389 RepID=UPI0024769E8B|nr:MULTISPECIES: hypothetical protein [unclassified Dysgonomonas]
MKLERSVKIIILSVFAIAALIVAVKLFQKPDNKPAEGNSLRMFVPASTSSLWIVKENLNQIQPFLRNLKPIVGGLQDGLRYPMGILYKDKDITFIASTDKGSDLYIRTKLKTELFPYFPPKKRQYKGQEILFFTSGSNDFFSCVFLDGIFACGYNYKVLEDIIDTRQSGEGFFADKEMVVLADKLAVSSYISFFAKDSHTNLRMAYSATLRDDALMLDGYASPRTFIAGDCCDSLVTNTPLSLDFGSFPDSLLAFEVQKNTAFIPDSFAHYFMSPSYRFFLPTDNAEAVHLVGFHGSRFYMLDEMIRINRRASSGATPIRQASAIWTRKGLFRIYRGTEQFNKQFFGKREDVFFTFRQNRLIFSGSENNLKAYLSAFGNFRVPQRIDTSPLTPCSSAIYSIKSGLQECQCSLFPIRILIPDSEVNILCHPENDLLKVNVTINNF